MFQKEVAYNDLFTGETRKKTLLFNLTKKELMDFAANQNTNDLQAYIAKIQEDEDKGKMFNLFNDLVLSAYGERTEAGGFIKKDREGNKLADVFETTEAYSNFIVEMLEDPTGNSLNEFFAKVIPAEMAADVKTAMAKGTIPQIAQTPKE